MMTTDIRKPKKRATRKQEKAFREAMTDGCCVEEATTISTMNDEQVHWMCRRDPLLNRLVDQEASLDDLTRQAKAILNDATHPKSTGFWDRNQKLRAAKLVIETVKSIKPDLLLKEPQKPQTMDELVKESRRQRGATAPGTKTEQ